MLYIAGLCDYTVFYLLKFPKLQMLNQIRDRRKIERGNVGLDSISYQKWEERVAVIRLSPPLTLHCIVVKMSQTV